MWYCTLFISKSEGGSSERSCRYDINLIWVNFKFGSLLQKSCITLRQLLDLSIFVFHLKTREVIVIQYNVGAFQG